MVDAVPKDERAKCRSVNPSRQIPVTVAVCLVIGGLTAIPHGGFVILPVLPFLAFFFFLGAYRAWKRPERRSLFIARMAVWCLLLCLVTALHLYYYLAARAAADNAARAITAFKAQHGYFPKDLVEADRGAAVQARNWMVVYAAGNNSASLIYPATFVMFEAYVYDFAASKWVYVSD